MKKNPVVTLLLRKLSTFYFRFQKICDKLAIPSSGSVRIKLFGNRKEFLILLRFEDFVVLHYGAGAIFSDFEHVADKSNN